MTFFKRALGYAMALKVVWQRLSSGYGPGQPVFNRLSARSVVLPAHDKPPSTGGSGFALRGLAVALMVVFSPAGVSGLTVDLGPMGHINWESAEVVAHGVAKAAQEWSQKQALEAARFNLFSGLKTVRILGSLTVADVVKNDLPKIEELIAIISAVPLALQKEQSGDSLKVTLSLSMRGAFSQLMLPAEIQQIEAIKLLKAKLHKDSGVTTESKVSQGSSRHTGLIVDALGLDLQPALVVRVMDENGELLYGPGFSSRDYAVSWGVVGYASGTTVDEKRLGMAPLRVEALRVAGAGRSDLTISNSAADEIRGLPEHVSFLRECRIVIWVD